MYQEDDVQGPTLFLAIVAAPVQTEPYDANNRRNPVLRMRNIKGVLENSDALKTQCSHLMAAISVLVSAMKGKGASMSKLQPDLVAVTAQWTLDGRRAGVPALTLDSLAAKGLTLNAKQTKVAMRKAFAKVDPLSVVSRANGTIPMVIHCGDNLDMGKNHFIQTSIVTYGMDMTPEEAAVFGKGCAA